MPRFWMVTANGIPFKKGFTDKREAEKVAERWQRGMLRHRDDREYYEVKRDKQAEKEFDESWDEYKRGNPQKYVYHHDSRDSI